MFAGGTVTVSAMDLAAKMGCSPVITIGLDLCFADDGTTHANETMYHGRRLEPEQLIRVPGNFQKEVLTTNQFRCYIHLLEEYIDHHPETRSSTRRTAGPGARMKLISPSGLGCLAAPPFDAHAEIERVYRGHSGDAVPFEKIRAELETVSIHLETLMHETREAAMICNQIILLLKSPHSGDQESARRHLHRLEEIDQHLADAQKTSVFLKMSLWPASYKSNARKAGHEELYSEAMLVNRRARELYEQISGAAKWTRDLLKQVVREMHSNPKFRRGAASAGWTRERNGRPRRKPFADSRKSLKQAQRGRKNHDDGQEVPGNQHHNRQPHGAGAYPLR